ncbi:hypothetical protein F4780DRAFT_759774 [Xylariomycetidae sp. FL0641]|nr:hypothetical protein F4780DRAFT_759774 [Xylariomycetidae sp. FL0641]
MPISLPTEFSDSYLKYRKYPRLIVSSSTYGPALQNLRARLNRKKGRLFLQEPNNITIPIREIHRSANGQFTVTKRNVLKECNVKDWLGDTYQQDPNNPDQVVGALATKPDPICRFIFLVSNSALAPLEITRDALLRILAYHQVMPNYIDFLLVYGAQEEDRELRYSGFRSQTTFVNPEPGHIIPDLNRSGRQHEICYNLKGVDPKRIGESQPLRNQWKIRQSAIYHRFDLGTGTTLWILGDPRETVKPAIGEVLPEGALPASFRFSTMAESFSASLDTHLVLASWASNEWRWDIEQLEETIDNTTRPVLLFDDNSLHQPRVLPRAVARVQEYEDKVNEVLMVMESNINIMTKLRSSYKTLVEDPEFPAADRDACQKAFKQFATRIDEFIFDLKTQTDRARLLAKFANDRKTIVLEQAHMQSATKQERLAESMWQFAERGQKEAIAMRVITVIGIIYLPPTFVSTFFSTDVIKYQDGGADQVYFSRNAMYSFLYVAIPLWVITILPVVYYYKREAWKRLRKPRGLVSNDPKEVEFWEKSTGSSDGSEKNGPSFVQYILGRGHKAI